MKYSNISNILHFGLLSIHVFVGYQHYRLNKIHLTMLQKL